MELYGDTMYDYFPDTSAVFRMTLERYGGLSNMHRGYPLTLGRFSVRSTEHLYQALRYPEYPEIQRRVLSATTSMDSKREAYRHLSHTRSDWDDVKVRIMITCCTLKLAQHWASIRSILDSTGSLDIVEYSKRDDFWGAKPTKSANGSVIKYRGYNHLGRIWMDLRSQELPAMIYLPDEMRVLCGEELPEHIRTPDFETTDNLL